MTDCIENVLFFASYTKNTLLAEECLQNGYNPDSLNQYRSTPLSESVLLRDFATAELLIAHKADPHHLNIWDCSPFFYCPPEAKHIFGSSEESNLTDLSCCESLMSNYAKEIYAPSGNHPIPQTQHEINQRDAFGYTPLLWSVWYGRIDDFQHCLDTGADINKPASNGATPLMLSCQKNREKMFWKLIELGADTAPLDSSGNSALVYSLRTHFWFDEKVSNFLVKHSHSSASSSKPLLTWSTLMDASNLVDWCLQQDLSVNQIDNEGNTALAYAAYWGNYPTLHKLLENDADINLFDASLGGKPPLLWAIIGKHLNIVKILVNNNGADVNQIDSKTGNSAIFYATLYTDVKITRFLLQKGADGTIPNKTGATPEENAAKANLKKLTDLLQQIA